MHSTLVHDIAVVLIAAGAAGWLCKCLGMSAIVGYLLAGVLIGPNMPLRWIADEASIKGLADVGLVFVMFAIGMHLGLRKMMRMGFQTVFATMLGAVFMFLVTLLLGQVMGWEYRQCLFLAAMLMVSSSAVIAKIMQELHLTHDKTAQTVLGMTISEDVVAVVMLAILGAVTKASGGGAGAANHGGGAGAANGAAGVAEGIVSGVEQVGSAFTNISSFVILVLAVCLLFVPKLVRRLELSGDPDLRNVGVAGLLLMLAFCAETAGFSFALGAFLFGAIIAELPQKGALEKSFESVVSLFSSLFFVSIGMLADPRALLNLNVLALTGALVLFALVGRPVACGLAMLLTGSPPEEARRGGLLLTPLGEFTFLIATAAVNAAVFPEYLYPVSILLAIATVLVTPFMNRHAGFILKVAAKLEPSFLTRSMELYHVWLVKLRSRPPRGLVWKTALPKLLRGLLELLLATGVVVFVPRLWDSIQAVFPRLLNHFGYVQNDIGELLWRVAFWSLTGVVLMALWWSVFRHMRDVIPLLARGASGVLMPRKMLETVLWLLFAGLFLLWLTVLFPAWKTHFTPDAHVLPLIPFLLLLAFVVGVGWWFSRQLRAWRQTVEETLSAAESAPGEHGAPPAARAGIWSRFAGEFGDWDIHLQDCSLPENAACAGESLRALAIPTRFGASVVSIDRNGCLIARPGPDTCLYPGDRLSLLGRADELGKARHFLDARKPRPDAAMADADAAHARLETCRMPDSPRAGRTLAELRVAENTGARIAAIQRDGQRIVNPSGAERLLAGDNLLVMTNGDQLKRFEQWLAAPAAAADAAANEGGGGAANEAVDGTTETSPATPPQTAKAASDEAAASATDTE